MRVRVEWIDRILFADRDRIYDIAEQMGVSSSDFDIGSDLIVLVYDRSADHLLDWIKISPVTRAYQIAIDDHLLICVCADAVLPEFTRAIGSLSATSMAFRHENDFEKFV